MGRRLTFWRTKKIPRMSPSNRCQIFATSSPQRSSQSSQRHLQQQDAMKVDEVMPLESGDSAELCDTRPRLTPTCLVCSAPTSAVCCASCTQSACAHKYSPSSITYTVNLTHKRSLSGITYTVRNIQLAYIHKCSLSCIMYSCLMHTNTVYLVSCTVGLHTQVQSARQTVHSMHLHPHKYTQSSETCCQLTTNTKIMRNAKDLFI